MRELVRILHVNLPNTSYNPDDPSLSDIPAHHREDKSEEDSGGFFSSVTGLVWNAIEFGKFLFSLSYDPRVANNLFYYY